MIRILILFGTLMLLATTASAISAGPGGYIYWECPASGDSYDGTCTKLKIYRAQLDTSYNLVGSVVNFDNLAVVADSGIGGGYDNRNVEVLDPRQAGGSGSLDLSAHLNNVKGGLDPCEVVKVANPTTNSPTNSVIVNFNAGNGVWDNKKKGIALPAPANWIAGSQSNGVSLVVNTSSGSYVGSDGNKFYVRSQNSSNPVDNSTGNGTAISTNLTSGSLYDLEFGPDKGLYRSLSQSGTYKIDRTWAKSDGTTPSNLYYAGDCSAVGVFTGIAVGRGNLGKTLKDGKAASANNIVYCFSFDCVNLANALWAFQDVNGDNVITAGTDRITRLWERNDGTCPSLDTIVNNTWSSSQATQHISNANCDIELSVGANGQETLVFNPQENGWVLTGGYVLAVDLADNGLALSGTAVKTNIAGLGAQGYGGQGFELDMSPVPEPATLTLLASGVVAALGGLRRRRAR